MKAYQKIILPCLVYCVVASLILSASVPRRLSVIQAKDVVAVTKPDKCKMKHFRIEGSAQDQVPKATDAVSMVDSMWGVRYLMAVIPSRIVSESLLIVKNGQADDLEQAKSILRKRIDPTMNNLELIFSAVCLDPGNQGERVFLHRSWFEKHAGGAALVAPPLVDNNTKKSQEESEKQIKARLKKEAEELAKQDNLKTQMPAASSAPHNNGLCKDSGGSKGLHKIKSVKENLSDFEESPETFFGLGPD